ncbi:MAG TPA: LysR family transcriptional regulator [Firmicutes bacterium]|nr:LysR family transcriptional regulator [Bacillota bacterium]
MELQQLKTFMAVAEVNSFTKAAQLLDYAQSSISAQVRSLEDELGIKLFERIGRGICPTQEGKRLLIYAKQLIDLAAEAKESLMGDNLPQGTLTIGAPESLSIFKLPALLQAYKESYPKVKLILKLGKCCDIYGWIRDNTVDIGFMLSPPISAGDINMEKLSHEVMTLVASRSHPLANKGTCAPENLMGEDLIQIEEPDCCYRLIFEAQLREAGIQPGSVFEFGSVETTKKCVMSGLGISMLPQMTVEQEIAAGQLEDLGWTGSDFNIYTQMIYHKGKWLSPALTALIQLSREILIADLS